MEYLSRILSKIGELEQFKFRPRCRDMKLTHLCFADDLIMCCKGEFTSIYLMLRAFKLFSDISGLKTNVNKSAFYTCGVNEGEENHGGVWISKREDTF